MLQTSGSYPLSASQPTSLSPAPSAKQPLRPPRPPPKPSPLPPSSGKTVSQSSLSPHLPARSPSPRLTPPSPRSLLSSEGPIITSSEEEDERETEREAISLHDFVQQCSTVLPLRMKVKKGYHGGDERHSIATGDVYNIHFVKKTKVVVLKDRKGASFNIPLNSAVQFAPVFSSDNDPQEKGATYERVSDIMSLKNLPKVIRATKPHVRVDPKSTIEKFEVFIVQSVMSLNVRKKVLKVYSITCNKTKLLLPDSAGAFSTEPSLTYLYLLEIIEHFFSDLPLQVKVVMNDIELSDELPFYLTHEVATLSHLDSEISLIASTNWGQNDMVSEEDQLPVEIPVDLPIEVVVQATDIAREAHLSHHTKMLYERFDPSRIRHLRARNIRRGFEKEGMELQRPDRIYDIPDVCFKKMESPQRTQKVREGKMSPPSPGRRPRAVSPQLRPRLATPKPAAPDSTYAQAYQPLLLHTQFQKGSGKPEYAIPESRSESSSPSPVKTASSASSPTAGQSPGRNQRALPHSRLPGSQQVREKEELEVPLENRVEILEREVLALRAEIAKLRTLVSASGSAEEQRVAREKRKNIQQLKSLSTEQVAELLQKMKMGQYSRRFTEQEVTGAVLAHCSLKVLKSELGVASKLHRLRLLQIISGDVSLTTIS